MTKRHSIREVVAEIDPPRFTVADAAERVGKSPDTLKRWKQIGVFKPSEHRMFGSLTVDLYTEDDLRAMQAIAAQMRPGPKLKVGPRRQRPVAPQPKPNKRQDARSYLHSLIAAAGWPGLQWQQILAHGTEDGYGRNSLEKARADLRRRGVITKRVNPPAPGEGQLRRGTFWGFSSRFPT